MVNEQKRLKKKKVLIKHEKLRYKSKFVQLKKFCAVLIRW